MSNDENIFESTGQIAYNKHKESTHSKMWMPQWLFYVLTDIAYPVSQTG